MTLMVGRGYRYRLAPSALQERRFRDYAGVCRLIYNLALEQRSIWGRRHKINLATQSRELTALRSEFDWIAAISRTAQDQALRDLDQAFTNFFARRSGYPTHRRKGQHDTFRFKGSEVRTRRLNARWSEVLLPKIGWVRYRDTRAIAGELQHATVALSPLGWQISFTVSREVEQTPRLAASVGIDRGVTVPMMLSTGEAFHMPPPLAALDRRCRRAQKVAARRVRGSQRHRKAMQRVAAIRSRAGRVRADWQHNATTAVARRFGIVTIEDLNTAGMTASAGGTVEAPGRNVRQKAGLNRAILNVGWGGLETKLAYKLAERGGVLVRIDPAFTSQTCSDCGAVDRRSRESQARFVCSSCGFHANADHNAAINIESRGRAAVLDVEARRRAAEASTMKEVA